jgi:hypothetical protein
MRRALRWAAVGMAPTLICCHVRAGGCCRRRANRPLLVPVQGVALEALRSSFGAPGHGPHEGSTSRSAPVFAWVKA